MPTEAVLRVRRFNRAVTERVGALSDHYLGRPRPLGASRLLWEIGGAGAELRDLRARLALDSGYLSRLLRTLERQGLVAIEEGAGDRRVRRARLTGAGRRERALLDRRSDALARDVLAPLSASQRARLLEAMAEVERMLGASQVEIVAADPAGPEARWCLAQYFAELDRRFAKGFDPALTLPTGAAAFSAPAGLLLIARLRGRPIGCGAVKLPRGGPAEVKRLWVSADARGLGLGQRLLGELEGRARAAGARAVRLDTNRALTEAMALYRRCGYREVPAFNAEPYAHHWFAKRLRARRRA